MPAVKITQKPIGTPGDDTHFLVTQPELPEGYTPTGQETEEELAELKVESVREIEMDDMVELIQDKLDMDVTPTTGSSKPVTSGGIKAALDLMDDDISSLNEDITNLETNKQDVLTFDSAPTAESTNPVTSAGIKMALDSVDAEIGELKENLNEEVSDLKSALKLTSYNLMLDLSKVNTTKNGVTFTWHENRLTANGTPTNTAFVNVFDDPTGFPSWATPGSTFKIAYSASRIAFRIYPYIGGSLGSVIVNAMANAEITIPQNIDGLLIRFAVGQVGTEVNETVEAFLYNVSTNKELEDAIETSMIYRDLMDSTDLNDYTDTGFYTLATASIYVNCPVTRSRRKILRVYTRPGGNIEQWLDNVTDGRTYFRMRYSGTWMDWVETNENTNKMISLTSGFSVEDYASGTTEITYDAKATILNRAVELVRGRPITAPNGYVQCSAGDVFQIVGTINGTTQPDLFADIKYRIYFTDGTNHTSLTLTSGSNSFVVPSGYTSLTVTGNAILAESPSESLTEIIRFDYVLLKYVNPGKVISPQNLTICTFNAGLYNYGHSNVSPYERQNLDKKDMIVRKWLAENAFDIICCQENTNLDMGNGKGSNDAFTELYPFFYKGNMVLTMASKYVLGAMKTGYFTDMAGDDRRGWMMAEIFVAGLRIALFNCHPAYQDTTEGASVRQLQYSEIINSLLADYDDAILFGDWNAYDISEFKIFADNGYKIMNGGYLGTQYSHPAIGTAVSPLDNIIIKGDHLIGAGYLVEPLYDQDHKDDWNYYVSDHIPLVAKITVY